MFSLELDEAIALVLLGILGGEREGEGDRGRWREREGDGGREISERKKKKTKNRKREKEFINSLSLFPVPLLPYPLPPSLLPSISLSYFCAGHKLARADGTKGLEDRLNVRFCQAGVDRGDVDAMARTCFLTQLLKEQGCLGNIVWPTHL